MKLKNSSALDTWLTPRDFYNELNDRFWFDDFDPCPPDNDITKFDGLSANWAPITFFNPPYSKSLKEKFIYKAWCESMLGKVCVGLVPVSTSTRIFHELILPNATVEFIPGRLKFEGIDREGNWVNSGNGRYHLENIPANAPQIVRSGQSDSMLIIFPKLHT